MTDTPHSIRRGELEIFQIDNAACSAEISLFGGQLLHWQPSGQKPVLWLSESAKFDGTTALRGASRFAGRGLALSKTKAATDWFEPANGSSINIRSKVIAPNSC